MLYEIVLTALMSLNPAEKKALNEFQTRLKKEGYDISQYVNDPRFGIYRFEKEKAKKQTNYADTTQSWYMRKDSLEKCADFIEENYYWLKRVEEKYGPSPEHITSVLQLETNRGQYTGEFPLLIAFSSVYINRPDRRNEYLKYTKDFLDLFSDTTDNIILPKDIFEIKGSWAGAYSIAQGMPGIIKKYGPMADGDGDGIVDLMKIPDGTDFLGNIIKKNGFNKNPSKAIQKYNNGHRFYGSSIEKHTKELEKIMNERKRIPPSNITYLPNIPKMYTKPNIYGRLKKITAPTKIPELENKNYFIRKIITNFSNFKKSKK